MKEETIKKKSVEKGYKYKAKVVWEKLTTNGIPVNSSGLTTRKSTETMYIFQKGEVASIAKLHRAVDLIRAKVRGASVKPEEAYQNINRLVSEGHFIEIFGRKHNVRANYVTFGNQLKLR